MAIYTKSGGEIKSVTPYLKRNGEIITPTSVWVKHGGEVHKVWPVEDGPFEIYDQATLEEFRDRVNAGEYDLDAVVTADFTLTGDFGEPIGNIDGAHTEGYSGTFDGGNRTIDGLKVETGDWYAGLFAIIESGGIVKNVRLAGGSVTVTSVNGWAGGVVALSRGTVSGCHNSNAISSTGYSGKAGGIVAEANLGVVENCENVGEVTGGMYTGGIIGNVYKTTIEHCTNHGSVNTETFGGDMGGIVGNNDGGTVTDCTNTGTVTGATETYSTYSGGIVGDNKSSGVIEGCHNEGDITGYVAGGIVATNYGTVTNCTNTGTVTGPHITELSATEDESTSAAGGIAGYNVIGSTVEGNTNEGEVTGAAHTGDIIGMEGPAIEDVPEEAAATESEEE